jgi:membrane-bound metal-dependent hydrolase YbcI (DUF457 family)
MDILTHVVSGIAVSSVIAGFSAPKSAPARRIIAAGAVGGAFPDIDAISLWSKFDVTAGKLLGLAHSGKDIYFGKFWYSHHGFFHSLGAAVIAGFIIGASVFLFRRMRRKNTKPFPCYLKDNLPVYMAFVAGCTIHALGDMFTPASVWGGVRFFWPLQDYAGGWGKIWWWNNYDIFLLLCVCSLINILLIILANFVRFRVNIVVFLVFLFTSTGVYYQANRRKTNYAYTGHTGKYNLLEQQSKEEQQEILGKKTYRIMQQFDKLIPFNF